MTHDEHRAHLATLRLPAQGSPDAPKYWKNEVGGLLAMAVEQFLRAPGAMTRYDVALMRAYLSQWIDSPVWEMNPEADAESKRRLFALRAQAAAIERPRDVVNWIHDARHEGIDPL